MLINGSKLSNAKILSLHIGGPVATVKRPVIEPSSFKIIALEVAGPLIRGEVGNILDVADIREVANVGIIIDSTDDLVQQDDVIKVAEILKLNFALVGLKVKTRKGAKLGKVIDFVLDTETFMIQQLIVHRPMTKSLIDPELTIPRSEIVEVNDYEVIVKDEKKTAKKKAAEPTKEFVPNFVNPFREPTFSTMRNRNPGGRDTE